MKQIPAELLNEIFSRLHQFDKVTCMSVCKHWKRIIEQYCLYQSVCVIHPDCLNALSTKVQGNPKVTEQIKDLVLFGNDVHVWAPLLASLKTVRRFILCSDSTHEEITSLNIDYQIHNTIEYITECSPSSVALELLSTNICSMLTTLIVHDFSDDIVPWLVNAPALRRLKLSPESISFEDINGIHDDVPGLQHLEITYGIITNDGFDDPIEPATSIVECVFLRSDTAVPKNVLEYSYRKYPNASSLTACLNTDILRTKRFDKETHSGWINLFRFMGKKLKKLCYFNEADDRDLFETLDKHDCHLNYLHLVHFKQASLQKIAQSKQILSLQTLVLLNVVTESFDWLKQLQVLQKFKLCHRGESTYTISLNDILNNCPPKLISLSLEHVDIADDLEPSTPSNIKHLSFYQIKLPARTDAYISHHFPGLKKLKLRGFSIDQRKFDVSTFDLHVLHITCSHDDYFTKVMISTLKNREQRLYQFKDRGDAEIDPNLKTLLPQALSYPSHEIDVSPDFTLVCHSLGKFISV